MTKMMNYLLSIVIPTRNRECYCLKVVEQILEVTSELTEIVVQDNSDSNELSEVLQKKGIERLVVNHTQGQLSFTDNFSAALESATGRYVCMIGDDDGVLPVIEKVADWAYQNGIDAVIPGLNAVYIWPSQHPIVAHGENGYLCLSYLHDSIIVHDAKKALISLSHNGFQNYQKVPVPRLYHGLVSMNKLKFMMGGGIGGLTPDMYMSVALASKLSNVVSIGFPITVSGICPRSGSSASATGAHTGDLKNAPHFLGHQNYEWSNSVPSFYSVETIWADTAIHALADAGLMRLIDKKTLDVLYAILWNNYPQFRTEIRKTAIENHVPIFGVRLRACCIPAFRFLRRLLRRITRKPSDVQKFYGISDINSAVEIVMNNIKDTAQFFGSEIFSV